MTDLPRYAEQPAGDLLPATPEGILDWARKTDPAPSRDEVVEHVKVLWRDDVLKTGDVERLAIDYPELAGFA